MLLLITAIVSIPLSIKSHAEERVLDAITFDETTQCYVFWSADKPRQSNIYYKTIGFTISRCKYGVQDVCDTTTYITFNLLNLDESILDEEYTENGVIYTKWLISKTYMEEQIKKVSVDWDADINKAVSEGVPVYLKFDAIMTIYHGKYAP